MNLLLFKFLSERTTKSKSDTKPFIIQNLLCTSKANTCNIYLYRLGNVRLISLILCSKTEDYSRIGTNIYLTLRVIWRSQVPFLKPKGYIFCGRHSVDDLGKTRRWRYNTCAFSGNFWFFCNFLANLLGWKDK